MSEVKRMFLNDLEHLKRHVGNQYKDEDFNEAKAQFLNFRVHDTDKNDFLDGIELRRMVSHHHQDTQGKKMSEEEMIKTIDHLIKVSDSNNDNLISFSEFIKIIERG
ncbi:Multiple coagulation factor deficiency protein 2 [Thelohanellus kitauei]|uniref:Multiple coagulation factor deficiency protein 2 n=1 Tax=Thelohanellus kitauei TaxID=669202 RepID=A0A0C2NGF0_THEKT|nr:Multiple coagulation factor deficiency protein 2 [Thelohanellus kitauei]